jgi:hypothetical protein
MAQADSCDSACQQMERHQHAFISKIYIIVVIATGTGDQTPITGFSSNVVIIIASFHHEQNEGVNPTPFTYITRMHNATLTIPTIVVHHGLDFRSESSY